MSVGDSQNDEMRGNKGSHGKDEKVVTATIFEYILMPYSQKQGLTKMGNWQST